MELPVHKKGRSSNKRAASREAEEVPVMNFEITGNTAKDLITSRGKPSLEAYIAAAKAYNNENSKDPMDTSSADHRGQRKYTAYLRSRLRRRVNIVDQREGAPSSYDIRRTWATETSRSVIADKPYKIIPVRIVYIYT